MVRTAITWAGVIDTALLLLIGIGPKLALVPFLKITASMDVTTRAMVTRKMLVTAGTAALALVLLGELLRRLLHFTIGALSIAGGVILLVLAVELVLGRSADESWNTAGADPMRLAMVPLGVPFLLNPVGIVALVTISAEAGSVAVLAVEIAILAIVLLFDALVFRMVGRATLDESRMIVVDKVFGFLIAAIAVQLVLDGLVSAGVIAHVSH